MGRNQKRRNIGLNFQVVEKITRFLRASEIRSPKCAKNRPKWPKNMQKTELNAIFRHVVFASF